jgi:hypothetical protein
MMSRSPAKRSSGRSSAPNALSGIARIVSPNAGRVRVSGFAHIDGKG